MASIGRTLSTASLTVVHAFFTHSNENSNVARSLHGTYVGASSEFATRCSDEFRKRPALTHLFRQRRAHTEFTQMAWNIK